MSTPYHIKLLMVREFFSIKVSFSWKTEKLVSSFPQRVGEAVSIENMLLILSRGSVAHCFKLLQNERYR